MSDDANIIPFGKYKGRLVEEILVDDPGYLQWLAGQDWFRTKFTILHQVIINRGSEPEETPEHNALQVRFLDDDFCLRFLRHLVPSYEAQARNKFNKVRAANLQLVIDKIAAEKEAPRKADDHLASEIKRITGAEYYRDHPDVRDKDLANARQKREDDRDRHIKRLIQLDRLREMLLPAITEVEFEIKRQFEVRGIDVVLDIMADVSWSLGIEHDVTGAPRDPYWLWRRWEDSSHWRAELEIELKPTVGDDYSAVLRQMKANGSSVLFVGEYRGQGATQEQFVKTMATAGIRVVFARDIEEASR